MKYEKSYSSNEKNTQLNFYATEKTIMAVQWNDFHSELSSCKNHLLHLEKQWQEWLPSTLIGGGIGIAHGAVFEGGLFSSSRMRPLLFAASWTFLLSGSLLRLMGDGYQSYQTFKSHQKEDFQVPKDFLYGALGTLGSGATIFLANTFVGFACMPFKIEGSGWVMAILFLGSAILGGALDFHARNKLNLSV